MDSHTHSAFGRLEIVETGRRRRWSEDEKRRIVLESMSGPRQVSATARRHEVSRSQLLAWRRAMLAQSGVPGPSFVPAVVMPDASVAAAAVPLEAPRPRIEVVLRNGRRLIVEGPVDVQAVLTLARGLEALR
jgi:transposase